MSKIMEKLSDDLKPLVNDVQLKEAYQILAEKEIVFEQLRQALVISLPTTTNGLNDNGENTEMTTIENNVREFKKWLSGQIYYHQNKAYQQLIDQIEKYGDKLFSDPIADTPLVKNLDNPDYIKVNLDGTKTLE